MTIVTINRIQYPVRNYQRDSIFPNRNIGNSCVPIPQPGLHQVDGNARSEDVTVQITLPAGETLRISSSAFCGLGLVKTLAQSSLWTFLDCTSVLPVRMNAWFLRSWAGQESWVPPGWDMVLYVREVTCAACTSSDNIGGLGATVPASDFP